MAGLALVGVVALASGSDRSAGGGANLQLVAYQGADLIGGERTDLHTVLGQGRPVVLNFFAGLCPPCRGEMPGFQEVWKRHQDEVIIVGADIGPFLALGSHADARRLLDELSITYPAAYVEDNPVQSFNIVGMPTTVLFDATGNEVGRHTGFVTEEQLEEEILSLLATARR
jgi:thiol-disulfide isomerase/thioredoxin